MNKIIYIILAFLLSSCDTTTNTSENSHEVSMYRSEFSPNNIEVVETALDSIANEFKLSIFRKDREQMKILSNDVEAFYSCFYFKDSCILSISSVAVPNTLSIMAIDYNFDKFSTSELDRLTNVVLKRIEKLTSAKFILSS